MTGKNKATTLIPTVFIHLDRFFVSIQRFLNAFWNLEYPKGRLGEVLRGVFRHAVRTPGRTPAGLHKVSNSM